MEENNRELPGLTASEVAVMMRVDIKTVSRWAITGAIRSALTAGGHRRYYLSDVEAMLDGRDPTRAAWYKVLGVKEPAASQKQM